MHSWCSVVCWELFPFTHQIFTCSVLCMDVVKHLWVDCIPLLWDIPTTPYHRIVWFCSFHNAWCVLSQIFSALSRFVFFFPTLTIGGQNYSGKHPPTFDFIININTFIHSQWLLHFSLFCPSSILCDKSYRISNHIWTQIFTCSFFYH